LITVGGIDSSQPNSNDFKPMTLLVIPDNEGTALPGPQPEGEAPLKMCWT